MTKGKWYKTSGYFGGYMRHTGCVDIRGQHIYDRRIWSDGKFEISSGSTSWPDYIEVPIHELIKIYPLYKNKLRNRKENINNIIPEKSDLSDK